MTKTTPFDHMDYLDTPEVRAAYIKECEEDIKEQQAEIARLRDELKEFSELKEYAKSLGQETYLELHAKNERLWAALKEIAEYGYDADNSDAYPLKQIARKAILNEQPGREK